MNFSQWPSSPPISFSPDSNSNIDEFSLFIPNISLPTPLKNFQFISIFCEKDEVDDFINRGYLFVYSINTQEKRYYKMIKKICD